MKDCQGLPELIMWAEFSFSLDSRSAPVLKKIAAWNWNAHYRYTLQNIHTLNYIFFTKKYRRLQMMLE